MFFCKDIQELSLYPTSSRTLRFNTRRNAHRSLRWFYTEKRSPTAHTKCIIPSGII